TSALALGCSRHQGGRSGSNESSVHERRSRAARAAPSLEARNVRLRAREIDQDIYRGSHQPRRRRGLPRALQPRATRRAQGTPKGGERPLSGVLLCYGQGPKAASTFAGRVATRNGRRPLGPRRAGSRLTEPSRSLDAREQQKDERIMPANPDIDALLAELLDSGVSPKYVSRLASELDDHYADLEAEARRLGVPAGDAAVDAKL